MNDVPTDALATVHLFRELPPEDLARLAGLMEVRTAAAGTAIFLAREPGDALFVIVEGRVRIWLQDADAQSVTLSELGPGEFFGEMAVIDGAPRSANASAIDDCRLGRLRRQVFEAFLVEHPAAALDVIRGIGGRLRQTNTLVAGRVARNANLVHQERLSALDRVAIAITSRVGSFGFFLAIAAWTVLWTGYNILASLVPALNWHAFDPFPAFVAYLLISNVIQIMLMPLIMVGQNLQGRHAETRAQLDFEINQKAEREVTATLVLLERQTELLHRLMRHLDCRAAD
jgi:CRP-like cAMP-binding protein